MNHDHKEALVYVFLISIFLVFIYFKNVDINTASTNQTNNAVFQEGI